MGTETPLYNIVGEKVALGPVRRELLPLYQAWLNDFEATRWLGRVPMPMTAEGQQKWFEKVTQNETDVVFTVYERETGRPIGNTGLHEIHPVHRSAEFGIGLFEKSCWNKGYGTETTRKMLEYGFGQLGLHGVHLTVFAANERASRAYARAGFKPAGRMREAMFRDGRFHDLLRMDCLAREFETQ
jgi:RimJ/RimL family protein N-acetyltransferase